MFTQTCVSKNVIVKQIHAIFYLLWYSSIYKKIVVFPIPQFEIFNNTVEVLKWSLQTVTEVNRMKNIIIQVTYFLKVSMVNVVLLSYIKRKCFLKKNLATILTLKSKLSEKFQSFNTIDGRFEMLKNSWISKNFNKNLKHFTR